MTGANGGTEHVRRNVAAAVEAVVDARGRVARLMRVFEVSRVPMVIADDGRRFVEVNHPARLWFRLDRAQMRAFVIGDLTPVHPRGGPEQAWSRLLGEGRVTGHYPGYASDGTRVDLVYCGFARIMPGLHLIAFAPADWPAPGFDAIATGRPDASGALTPREIEVLALAADGLSAPGIARELGIGLATVRTHFANIYEKLGVANRAAAVAKVIRLGVIE